VWQYDFNRTHDDLDDGGGEQATQQCCRRETFVEVDTEKMW
jgi:hypothetical protein